MEIKSGSSDQNEVQLECFQLQNPAPELIPARPRRAWMDHFIDRQPYRCLPLTMANSAGWELLCPFDISITWNGGPGKEAISITSTSPNVHVEGFAVSHFQYGIVTFHTGYLFRTPPGWALSCMGPPNQPKDGIYALSGLVETEWLPFPFTMNWQMTRPGTVSFEKGEAFCFFTLQEHDKLNSVQPKLRTLNQDKDLLAAYEAWTTSRAKFNVDLESGEPDALAMGWQKHYMRGETPSGGSAEDSHVTRFRLKGPEKIGD